MNIFVNGDGISEDELALEVPDELEQTDLKRHAIRCALRYKALKRGQNANSDRLRRIEVIFYIVGGWIVLMSGPWRDGILKLLGLQ